MTWLGFGRTIILVTALITVSIFYTINFFRNVESKVYINDLVLDDPPIVSVSNKNFLMMFRHVYPESGPFYGQQEKFFTLKFFKIVSSPFTAIPFSQDRIPVPLDSCTNLNLNLTDVNYSQEEF